MLKTSLRSELADVRRRWGIPMLMITHDVEDVLALADVAFVYHAGRVVREIDLHAGTSRSLVVQGLGSAPEIEDTPQRRKLRGMLEAPGNSCLRQLGPCRNPVGCPTDWRSGREHPRRRHGGGGRRRSPPRRVRCPDSASTQQPPLRPARS